ncbi:helix-turn-helix domain-containing protein [Roseibium sp.]|uniref:AraC family transcriptional regulator n=1 Tax=Roseibium sp. TaxID=1936156 RepID=UPI003A96C00F
MKPIKEWARADALRIFRDKVPAYLLDWPRLAKDLSIRPEVLDDPEGVVPIALLYEVFDRAAQLMDDDAILFDLFSQMDLGNISSFDYLFVCASSIREGCASWARFNEIRSNSYSLDFTEDDAFGVLEWTYHDRHGPWRQNMFARMGWAAKRFEIALGKDVAPITIEMATSTPLGTSDFQKRYGSRLKFNQDRNAIVVPKNLLSLRPINNDDNLYMIIQRSALEEQGNVSRHGSPSLRVADAIAEAMKTGSCTLDDVAQRLAMSPRSVQRALENEGTSFRALTDEIRRSTATRYLRDTSLPIKEIAFLLGFSEMSAFSRAAKSWFGRSPKSFRQGTSAFD